MICSFLNPRQRIEGAKGNTREQRGHPFALQSQNRPTGYDHADLRRRMPQLARAPASSRRPGALQQ
ncbi:hypothetical protein NLP70_27160, partial [Escherichia coli]|nr:hypothetical protein [Escherichia coli]